MKDQRIRIIKGWIIKESRVGSYVLTHNGKATFYKRKPKIQHSWNEKALKAELYVLMKGTNY